MRDGRISFVEELLRTNVGKVDEYCAASIQNPQLQEAHHHWIAVSRKMISPPGASTVMISPS